jgi:hypothetical protein
LVLKAKLAAQKARAVEKQKVKIKFISNAK